MNLIYLPKNYLLLHIAIFVMLYFGFFIYIVSMTSNFSTEEVNPFLLALPYMLLILIFHYSEYIFLSYFRFKPKSLILGIDKEKITLPKSSTTKHLYFKDMSNRKVQIPNSNKWYRNIISNIVTFKNGWLPTGLITFEHDNKSYRLKFFITSEKEAVELESLLEQIFKEK